MRAIGRMMLVKMDVPEPHTRESGLYVPTPNTNFGGKLHESEKGDGEWWPHRGTVVCARQGGFIDGHRPTGEHAWNPQTGQHVEKLEEHLHPGWRMPNAGDTVWFGHKGINPATLDKDNCVWVKPATATFVVPADGSQPWAMGRRCLVEHVPEEEQSNQLITRLKLGPRLGIGIVRMCGDGFLEQHPDIRPGMAVRFKVAGIANPVVPYLNGTEIISLLPDWIIGVEENGIPEEELEQLKMAAREREEVVRQTLPASITVETPEQKKTREMQEAEERNWRWSQKMRDKTPLGQQRRYW